MDLPRNSFKHAIAAGRRQIGFWLALSDSYAAEAVAGAGFDWLVLDMEHAPNTLTSVLTQLQALAPYPGAAVVRPAWNDMVAIKQVLDLGAQTLLIPYVQTAEEAQAAVAAVRYPPRGVRGVSAGARASRYGRVADYPQRAEEELCLLVQVETAAALEQLEAIAAVEGVDGVFIGPADLAASLGHLGQPGHPEVKAAVLDAIRRLLAAGKPSGLLTLDATFADECLAAGAAFVAVGIDAAVLARGADALRQRFPS
ncbi:4-hydroxy-2-oxoheptanedioate aldolase [Phenylobacterium sp.]|jgi:4-hydroxy-2-oxoheptanedioate aldolase|uniref:4-hydroxy-2-oxoheptanedioate aldolase n=1 Tax=Phenylobacterium sp. TaxID=1871053 RepID=UPI002F93454C